MDRDSLIESNLPLVKQIANQIAKRTKRQDLKDDLIGAGEVSLCQAADSWDKNCSFTEYAATCIRNGMIDLLRAEDVLTPSERRKKKLSEEDAEEIGVALSSDSRLDWAITSVKNEDQESIAVFSSVIRSLSKIDQEILRLRILEDKTNLDAASALDITDTAANNRYTRAIARLKKKFLQ